MYTALQNPVPTSFIHARNPFFLLTGFAVFLTTGSLWFLLDVLSRGSAGAPVGILPTLSTILFIIGSTLLAGCVGAQFALYHGWEPTFLQRSIMGATVRSVQHPDERGHSWVTVSLGQSGLQETFQADPDEMKDLRVGEIVHLKVIGPYVAQVRRTTQVDPAVLQEAKFIGSGRHHHRSGVSWRALGLIALVNAGAAWCVSEGIGGLVTGILIFNMRRRTRLEVGDPQTVQAVSWGLVIVGAVVLIAFLIHLHRAQHDQDEIDNMTFS